MTGSAKIFMTGSDEIAPAVMEVKKKLKKNGHHDGEMHIHDADCDFMTGQITLHILEQICKTRHENATSVMKSVTLRHEFYENYS